MIKTKRITKAAAKAAEKANAAFQQEVGRYLAGHGALRPISGLPGEMIVYTPIGRLRVRGDGGCIYACFDDEHAAFIYTRNHCGHYETSNRASGKWNFQLACNHEFVAEASFERFRDCFERLMTYVPTAKDLQEMAARRKESDLYWKHVTNS